MNERSLRFNWE